MNSIQLFAFVILPIIIVAIGWGGAWLHVYTLDRAREKERLHPGE